MHFAGVVMAFQSHKLKKKQKENYCCCCHHCIKPLKRNLIKKKIMRRCDPYQPFSGLNVGELHHLQVCRLGHHGIRRQRDDVVTDSRQGLTLSGGREVGNNAVTWMKRAMVAPVSWGEHTHHMQDFVLGFIHGAVLGGIFRKAQLPLENASKTELLLAFQL